ncbi:FxSxx-COOH system tetratricopeptide repeat protein [Actinoplanes sp. NPDC023936]|uniref:FxSxx-COOH system tetratricopeptide repeat protein n=1 Tax=Actinoplanes sp. NPDC023936 TaxID=3154910 RepID=UPI0033F72E53
MAGRDFFISYASENRGWAEWIAAQLEGAGYSTIYQAADFRPGRDFVHEMHAAVSSAERTIAVLTPAYLRSEFGEAEWRAVFARDPSGKQRLLIPVRVQPCDPSGLLTTRVYVDLVDVDEQVARKKLLAAAENDRPRPAAGAFPGGRVPGATRFPGAGPAVSNLPGRNRVFTGRAELIDAMYAGLRSDGQGSAAVVSEAVHGLGGVGKTTLAIEYASRFRSDYELAWWIDAEQPATVPTQLAALGRRLGLPEAADERDAVAAVFAELRGRSRWLLIYDNAEQPASVTPLIPTGGNGHVLVTSRWPAWRRHAHAVAVSVWPRAESVAFLRARTPHTDDKLLGELAKLVGDLPLAVEEAAAYLEQTGEDLATYVELVRERGREIFAAQAAPPGVDQRRVASVWTLSLDRVHAEEPLAEQLLTLLAFLAPEVPRDLPLAQQDLLPEPLKAAAADRLVYNRVLEAAGRYALISLKPAEIGMHRLVQAVVQARLDYEAEARWVTAGVALVHELFPDDSWEPARWPECQRLLAQALAVADHAERLRVSEEQAGRLLYRASTYLRESGQYQQAEPLARRALTLTEIALGPDHVETAARHEEVGRVMRELNRLAEARTEFEQALAINLAALGPDHKDVSVWRGNLGTVLHDLGLLDEARTELEQTLALALETLGPDHPIIAVRRNTLGLVLQDLGLLDEARAELEQALAISLEALGPDHPTIGIRRNNLGSVLKDLGLLDEARIELEQALAISVPTLGPDHPDVGLRHGNLGSILYALGRTDEARTQFEQAFRISLAAVGPDHPNTETIQLWLDFLPERRPGNGDEW